MTWAKGSLFTRASDTSSVVPSATRPRPGYESLPAPIRPARPAGKTVADALADREWGAASATVAVSVSATARPARARHDTDRAGRASPRRARAAHAPGGGRNDGGKAPA